MLILVTDGDRVNSMDKRSIHMIEIEDRLNLERRISKAEESLVSLHEDIKEIKKGLRWTIRLIFGLNSTIIALLAKGIHLI